MNANCWNRSKDELVAARLRIRSADALACKKKHFSDKRQHKRNSKQRKICYLTASGLKVDEGAGRPTLAHSNSFFNLSFSSSAFLHLRSNSETYCAFLAL